MRTPARRLGAVAFSTLTTAGLALGGGLNASPAQAATSTYVSTASTWLSHQLTQGVVHNDQYAFDDYGLSLDVFLALDRLGTGSAARTSVLDALAKHPEAYISYTDAGVTSHYAGATGKLATAVELGGRNPKSFGGRNLVSRVESLISTRSGEVGRGVDSGSGDYSNTIGQAWVVRSLVGAKSSKATVATNFLQKQQCTAGFFRVTLEDATTTSSFSCNGAADGDASPSIDATALAIDALVVARDAGAAGLGDDIDDAASWLVSHQAADGSFADQGTANTNSTGLAAAALAGVGRSGAAANAAGWVVKRQVTAAVADRSKPLRRELGAIAFDTPAFQTGKTDGIPVESRDQWRRATAQAAPALASLLPATTLKVSAPTSYQHSGTTIATRTSGLVPGEHFATTLGSSRAVSGLAAGTGTSTASFTLPKSTGSYRVRTTGSRAVRTGSSVVKVLAPKTLRQSLAHDPVARRGTQTVTVRGLASHEPVRMYYRGDVIWHGSASASGVARHSFRVGSTSGQRKVRTLGKFHDRSTRLSYFRVR